MTDAQVTRLEQEIDEMNKELKPLRSFVLPGGSPAAAALHMARTISRRAERLMVELAAEPNEPVSAAALKYINRLSDLRLLPAATSMIAARPMFFGSPERIGSRFL